PASIARAPASRHRGRGTLPAPRGRSSVGRASASQAEGRGFETRRPLAIGWRAPAEEGVAMTARIVPGVALIAVGVLFLLGALDVVDRPARLLGAWWPLVFVLVGALLALERRRVGVGALVFVALGAGLLIITNDLV